MNVSHTQLTASEILILVSLMLLSSQASEGAVTYKRVCYYASWGRWSFLPISDIDPHICTHLIYAFSALKGNALVPLGPGEDSIGGTYEAFNNLKKQNKNLKTLLAVGGQGQAVSDIFAKMAATTTGRREFIASSVKVLRSHNFDGLDLDWEYPQGEENKRLFTLLVQNIRTIFTLEGKMTKRPPLLLTAAVAAGKWYTDTSYDVPEIASHLDFINLMTYDYHGSWETTVGHHTALHPNRNDTGYARTFNLEWSANYWVSLGAPKEKLIVGLATYGRTFTLKNVNDTDIGAPIFKAGYAGPFSKEPGLLSYAEICLMVKNGVPSQFLADEMVPYLVVDNQWIGYDDPKSFIAKLKWIKQNNFGGGMLWTMHQDDVKGNCGEKFPLLRAIQQELSNSPLSGIFGRNSLFIPYASIFRAIIDTQAKEKAIILSLNDPVTSKPSTTLAVTQASTSVNKEVDCAIKVNGYFRTTCTHFVRCVAGRKFTFSCPPNLSFNNAEVRCDHRRNVPECSNV